jgi:phage baseplate assembly protein W
MADGVTYGLNFPFQDSTRGDYLQLTEFQRQEVRASLVHLLLTRKGSRYYLPYFGTRLYEFVFEPFDGLTFSAIEADIRDSIQRYMPNLLVNKITIEPADPANESDTQTNTVTVGDAKMYDIYRLPGKGTADYTAKIKIDYATNSQTFSESDFIIINI